MLKFLTLCTAMTLSGCGIAMSSPPDDESSSSNGVYGRARLTDLAVPNPLVQAMANNISDQYVDRLKAVNCQDPSEQYGDCELQERDFNSGQFDAEKGNKERVLIWDLAGIEYKAVARYRSRVKGLYEIEAGQGVVEWNPRVTLPKIVWELLDHIDSNDFMPAAAFERLDSALINAAGDFIDSTGHGGMVANYLFEYNPNAQFVYLRGFDLENKFADSFCEDSDAFHQDMNLVANQLSRILQKHSIRYVNISGGHTLSGMRDFWRKNCAGAPQEYELKNRLSAIKQVYDVLMNTDGVMAFQASADISSRSEYPIETSNGYKNRLLVGHLAVLDANVDENGYPLDANKVVALPSLYYQSEPWTDVFINSGVEPSRPHDFNRSPLMQTSQAGFSFFPITRSYPSWMTPIALSTAIYIRKHDFSHLPFDNNLIQRIKNKLVPDGCNRFSSGKCKIQDPLRYKKQDLFFENYLISP